MMGHMSFDPIIMLPRNASKAKEAIIGCFI
jgi:hypothetical protein